MRRACPWENAKIVKQVFLLHKLLVSLINQLSYIDIPWERKISNAMERGGHEIPQGNAMHFPVSVPYATVSCYFCLEGLSEI